MTSDSLRRRSAFLLPFAAAPVASAAAGEAAGSVTPLPSGPLEAATSLVAEGAAGAARQGTLAWQAGRWRLATHGDLAAAYLNVIPTFRQAAGEDARPRTVEEELRERVAFTQFQTSGRNPGQAIAAAIDYLRRNNAAAGGEVVLPHGPPIHVVAPIAAAPGIVVRGTRPIEVPDFPRGGLGLFDVDGADDFTMAGLVLSLGRRCGPARILGDAKGFAARGLRIREGRSIWFKRGRQARITDVIGYGGTAIIGAGAGPEDLAEDIVATNIQGYDLRDEAIDLNYNVRSFHLSGFTFRRCSLFRNGEVIDIGGGECRDITIADGLIDCSGSTHTVAGIRIKRATRNVAIHGVHIINGKPDGSIGIHVTSATNVSIRDTHVDNSFARGFFAEPSVRDVSWQGGRCDSPLQVNGASDIRLDVTHDGGGTASDRPAYAIGFGARRVTIGGSVRGRPGAAAVAVGGGRGGAVDCEVAGFSVDQVGRAVIAQNGCDRLRILDLRSNAAQQETVLVTPGCRNTQIRGVLSVDGSAGRPRAFPTVRLGRDCHGSILRDVTARDTREGEDRSSGPVIIIDGPSRGVIVDALVGDNLAGPTQIGTDRLQESSVGAVLTLA